MCTRAATATPTPTPTPTPNPILTPDLSPTPGVVGVAATTDAAATAAAATAAAAHLTEVQRGVRAHPRQLTGVLSDVRKQAQT